MVASNVRIRCSRQCGYHVTISFPKFISQLGVEETTELQLLLWSKSISTFPRSASRNSSSAASRKNLQSPQKMIELRSPTTTSSSSCSTFQPPPNPWLLGTWHVTHSTFPMWKKSRNVTITYKALGSDPNPSLDNLVSYQGLSGDKLNTISGIDTPTGAGAWNWRGRGLLMAMSLHWEVLGYGGGESGDGEQWVVKYFAKTMFTPDGIDIISRRKEGLQEGTVQAIMQALGRVDSEILRRLAGEMFEVVVS